MKSSGQDLWNMDLGVYNLGMVTTYSNHYINQWKYTCKRRVISMKNKLNLWKDSINVYPSKSLSIQIYQDNQKCKGKIIKYVKEICTLMSSQVSLHSPSFK